MQMEVFWWGLGQTETWPLWICRNGVKWAFDWLSCYGSEILQFRDPWIILHFGRCFPRTKNCCCAVVLVSMVFWHWLFGNRWISMVLDSWLEWPASPKSNDFLRPIMLMFIVIIIDSYFDSRVVVFLSFWGCTVCWCLLRCIYCREACLILWWSLVLPWLSWIKHVEQIGALVETWPYHGQCLSLLRLKHFFSLATQKDVFALNWYIHHFFWSRIFWTSFFVTPNKNMGMKKGHRLRKKSAETPRIIHADFGHLMAEDQPENPRTFDGLDICFQVRWFTEKLFGVA